MRVWRLKFSYILILEMESMLDSTLFSLMMEERSGSRLHLVKLVGSQ